MRSPCHRFVLGLLLSFSLPCAVSAQSKNPIRESNIRAELGFLASDAMQGRGSGTNYERVAAEYIGSQFRQFGLEPAGDTDSAGNKTFVQRVPLESAKVGGATETSDGSATWNAIGVLKGSDPRAAAQGTMLS